MSRLGGWWLRLRRALRPHALDQQMAEEMRAHLDAETARRVALGEDAETARRRAAIEFGHVDSHQERVRDHRLGRGLEEFWRLVRFTVRCLCKSPGFAIVAIATIAIGVGAGTAVFSLVHAILLRSLPVPNPQELRVVHWSGADVRMRSINPDFSRTNGPRKTSDAFNHPGLVRLREQAGDMAEVFGFFPLRTITALTEQSGVITTDGTMVTGNFFPALGVRPLIGRLLESRDDAAAQPVAVISHAVWQRHFASDPAVLGQALTMQGRVYPIVGVLPPGFHGVRPGQSAGVYLPLSPESPYYHVPLGEDWHWFIRVMARLHPGHSDAQLAAALSVAFATVAESRMREPAIELESGRGGLGFDRATYGRSLLLMLGATGVVLLATCANLAGLSIARGAARTHEFALRMALGSGRRRLMILAFTESALLATLGGGLGLLLALWGRDVLAGLLAGSAAGLSYDLSLNRGVLLFGLIATFLVAVLAGCLPAWRAGRVDPLEDLKQRGACTPRLRLGRVLVGIQLSLSFAILAAAGLGARTIANLHRIDPGFAPEHLALCDVNPGGAGYTGDTLTGYYDRAQEALAAIPGVTDVALVDYALLSNRRSRGMFGLTHRPELRDERWTARLTVNESFFATFGIPLRHGRGFTTADHADAAKVIVVNEAFVRAFMDGQDPIGHTMSIWGADWRIVGVCGDAKLDHLKSRIGPTTYFPFRQRFYDRFKESTLRQATWAVRSTLSPDALRPALDRSLAQVDLRVPITSFTTQTTLLEANIGQERMLATLGSALGALALLLCCVGLYGLIAYDVTRRTGEIAIRMAIGAQPAVIARAVLCEALLLGLCGLAAGVPLALGATQLIKSQLFGVAAHDPLMLGSASALLLAVALLAAWLPARRAARADPITALRNN